MKINFIFFPILFRKSAIAESVYNAKTATFFHENKGALITAESKPINMKIVLKVLKFAILTKY